MLGLGSGLSHLACSRLQKLILMCRDLENWCEKCETHFRLACFHDVPTKSNIHLCFKHSGFKASHPQFNINFLHVLVSNALERSASKKATHGKVDQKVLQCTSGPCELSTLPAHALCIFCFCFLLTILYFCSCWTFSLERDLETNFSDCFVKPKRKISLEKEVEILSKSMSWWENLFYESTSQVLSQVWVKSWKFID